jgi:hypothetical protein
VDGVCQKEQKEGALAKDRIGDHRQEYLLDMVKVSVIKR